VCDDCHNRLHNNKQTLYRDPITQTWKIRPATWAEIPPDKRPQPGGLQTKGPPGAYTNSANRRPRHTTPEPGNPNPKPRLDEQRANTRRHNRHGDRLF
jgi:hypothetical protein